MFALFAFVLCAFLARVSGHSSIHHPSMYGFNVTANTKAFDYDNRPVAPLRDMPFDKWWFHNHLDFPPNPGDIFELPAGKPATTEIACHKGATTYFNSSEGKDIRDPKDFNNPCPNSPTTAFHTHGFDELEGCALAIAYKNDARAVQPEDFTVFSVNHTCVWTRFTDFHVPKRMPPCPQGGCICAFFWIHHPNGGGEENYMNGFKCNITGSTSNVPLGKPKVARRCGADIPNKKFEVSPANCTYGPKAPFYWFQLERNNVFEGPFSPPVYNDLYNFVDGAQDDIFEDSYLSIPEPSPDAKLPVLNNNTTIGTPKPSGSNSSSTPPSSTSSILSSSTSSPSGTPSILSSSTSSPSGTPSEPGSTSTSLPSPSPSPSTSGCQPSVRHYRRHLNQAIRKRSSRRVVGKRQHRSRNV